MQKVVSISLNGIAYQLEEPGYNQLRDYLERAEARLKDSPDRAEVMADLEQAIGEKCALATGPHKTVVSGAEIGRILDEMGPVESAEDQPAGAAAYTAGAAAASQVPPRRRLFKLREGAMWGGVCNGIAAYINVDVTWVRIAFVVLTLLTGIILLVYLAMVFIVPYANTSEERAAAFGAPFSTEEFLGRAKKKSEDFVQSRRWHREWRRQQRHWQKQFDHMNAQVRQAASQAGPYMRENSGKLIAGVFVPIAALIGACLFVTFILALFWLVAHQTLFGFELPHNVPLWVGIVGLVIAYALVSIPVRAIRYGAVPHASRHPGWSALHTLLWICFALLLFWMAYTFAPGVREVVDQLMWAADLTVDNLSAALD